MYKTIKDVINVTIKNRVNVESIKENDDLIEKIGLTSLEAVEILVRLESEFDIEIADEDLSANLVRTLSNIVTYFENKISTKEGITYKA